MMLVSNSYTSWTQDRFIVFLVFAVALHALVFFGISFGVTLNPLPRLADTLDQPVRSLISFGIQITGYPYQ